MSVKAFQLVCLLDQELLVVSGDKSRQQQLLQIESLECCGYDLYLGSNDGSILHFLLAEKSQPATGQATLAASRQLQRTLSSQRKPVTELRAASALHRLLVLCDNVISLADMSTLEPVAAAGARIKGAITFTLNENPASGGDPFCVELCLVSAKRRAVQIFLVYEDRVQIVKEVVTPEQPCSLAADGHFLCLALATQYIILNYNTGSSQDLFPYNSEEKQPIVKRISRQEFLLAGPGGLGMFATVAGISQRAPVRWSENVISAAVCFPYVVALDKEFITVHSMLDQQKKQTIPFKEGYILQDFEGRLLATTRNGIYILTPIPLENQIQDLLAGHHVDEALVLAKGTRRNMPKEKFQVMYTRILQQAGFIQFAQLQFSEARELFRSSQLDVRELISLYPFLLPTSSTFGRCHPPLHEYADLNQLTQGDQKKIGKCKQFLMSYLKEIRSAEVINGYKEDVDTALLKLYAEANHESLLDLLVSENACILTDCSNWLEKHKRYYALGLLYHYNLQDAAALQLWVKIVNGDLQDTTRADLFEYIVDFLTFCTDQELVWKYSDWVLQKSEQIGVYIFTRRHFEEQKEDGFCPDDVLNCLKKYPKALLKYLEHLVLERGLKKEKYHTYLAVMYLEEVLWLKSLSSKDCGVLVELRAKFRRLLQKSDTYRVHLLLDKMKDSDLYLESAILHGKLEEHDKALNILVHQLKDFSTAEDYCMWTADSKDAVYRQRLFHLLLSVYLNPDSPDDALLVAGVDLINKHCAEFDTAQVLTLLPDTWSVQLLAPFLAGSMRGSIHKQKMARIAVELAKAENLTYKHEKAKWRGHPIVLSDKSVCHICRSPIHEPTFASYPDGSIVHTHCVTSRPKNTNMAHGTRT